MLPENKRRLIYNRRVVPGTFVFFFHRGPGESSWSIRDYSVPGSVALRYASDFQDAAGRIPSASEIRAAAEYDFPAPSHPTTDLDHWHAMIQAKNAEFLTAESLIASTTISSTSETPPGEERPVPSFPVLNLPKLMALPKARKRGDIERILHSKNSEDYVTWNFFQLLESVPVSSWWPSLLKLAGASSIDPADTPAVRLWQTTAAPREYERLSRERMRTSGTAAWRERSLNENPVEGPSEIDIAFEGRTYLAYVEAKLGSDISLSTTYDPERNQIARNLDCVLEVCETRRPMFWMFVRDRQPSRAYTQLMNRYRGASELKRSLPHRPIDRLEQLAATLAVVTWQDLLDLAAGANRTGPQAEVYAELRSRVRSE